jgi:ATP-dependent DNA helicase RecQ
VTDVLIGASTGRIRALRHDRLTTYGSLTGTSKHDVRAWIDQLMGRGLLVRTDDAYPTLALTASGARVLRGEATAGPLSRIAQPARSRGERTAQQGGRTERFTQRDPENENLFEALRTLRRALAEERGVPPYVIFSDASLREMARLKPVTAGAFLEVKGVGAWKSEAFGERFLQVIRRHI